MSAMEHDALMQTAVGHHRAGRFAEAAALYQRVLAAAPEQPDALHLLGLATARMGDREAALALVERAVAAAPDHPGFRFSHGNLLLEAKRFAEAEAALRIAVTAEPRDAAARNALAVAIVEQKRSGEAEALLRKLLETEPDFVPALDNLAALLLKRETAKEAEALARRSLAALPDGPEALNNLGSALHKQDRHDEAEVQLKAAIRERPQFVEAMYNLALSRFAHGNFIGADRVLRRALKLDGRSVGVLTMLAKVSLELSLNEEGLAFVQRAYELDPTSVEVRTVLAFGWRDQGDYDEAERMMRELIAQQPTASGLASLGHLLWERGKMDEAQVVLRQALAINPKFYGARRIIAQCARVKSLDEENVVACLAALGETDMREEEQMSVTYALAKSYDDIGEYAQAFEYYREFNRLKKASLPPYQPDGERTYERACRSLFTPETVARAAKHGSSSEVPVFVVGLPRSGTTLTEQIIASHPDAFGAGELIKMRELTARIGATSANRGGPEYPAAIFNLRPEEIRRFSHMYLDHLYGLAGVSKLRIVDKMPLNLKHLGLIAILFPNARIVHCVRHPVDNCLSMYFQNFGRGNFYANDLVHVAQFYASCETMYAVWQERLPLRMMDFPYEAVVEDPATWSRRLIAHVDLPWDDACLSFHESDRAVRTASAWQVKQPIYKRSVARWKRYGAAIQPLLDALRAEGVEFEE